MLLNLPQFVCQVTRPKRMNHRLAARAPPSQTHCGETRSATSFACRLWDKPSATG